MGRQSGFVLEDRLARQSPLFVRSLAKAAKVLEAFDSPSRFLGLVDIAAATGLDNSTVQRLVYTLTALGYLERDAATRRYALGKSLLGLSFSFLRAHPLVANATPVLIDLRRSCHERVGLSLWEDLQIIYAVRLQSKRETFSATLIGRRMPLYCTAGGLAILSQLPEDEARKLIQRCDRKAHTAYTVTDAGLIMEKVRKARGQGYSFNREEALAGELTVAAPVRDERGHPGGAVHISGSLGDWTGEKFERLMAPLVVAAAQAISF
jgi:DNA-binding IclR family transcriptional regulator